MSMSYVERHIRYNNTASLDIPEWYITKIEKEPKICVKVLRLDSIVDTLAATVKTPASTNSCGKTSVMQSSEFDQWCHRLALSPATRDFLARLRASPPVRRVQGRAQNVSGTYASRSTESRHEHYLCSTTHNSSITSILGGKQMSTQQNLLTVGEARTIRQDGRAEFVAHNASIQPDRYTFANLDELTAYLGQVLGGQPEGGGI